MSPLDGPEMMSSRRKAAGFQGGRNDDASTQETQHTEGVMETISYCRIHHEPFDPAPRVSVAVKSKDGPSRSSEECSQGGTTDSYATGLGGHESYCRWRMTFRSFAPLPQYSRILLACAAMSRENTQLVLVDIGANIGDTVAIIRELSQCPILWWKADEY